MRNPLDMSGKAVIVTGGARGVGEGIAKRFLEFGANVVVCDIKAPDKLPSAGGKEVLYLDADLRKIEEIDKVVQFTTERLGHLDVLVNNAGGTPPGFLADAKPRLSESIIQLNLTVPIHFSQRANAIMQKQEEGGCIINIASVSAVRPSPETAVYGAAKAGLISLTTSLAVEWAPKVRVNAITSGMILTEAAKAHYGTKETIEAIESTIPLRRMGAPEDLGDVCLFLASPLSSYMSGGSVLVHGGGERPAYMAVAEKAMKEQKEQARARG
jgi:NAD(P)-dependent dehydrogenase (short-subunit alcohol dehydrogenase family)